MQVNFGSRRQLSGSFHRTFVYSVLGGIGVAALVAFAQPAAAQQDGVNVWRRGGCAACHGGLAQGGGEGENPDGPSLRTTELDRDLMRETIACGRGEMPFNLEGAYTEVECYGIPAGDAPPEGFTAGTQLSAEDIDTLVDFLFEHVVGVTRVTRGACAPFFGGDPNSPVCAQYPR